MNKSIFRFLKDCSELIDLPTPIFEFGSRRVQNKYPPLKTLFNNKTYVGFDNEIGENVDCTIDCQDLILIEDRSAGTIIATSLLEHVKEPLKAITEFKRILKSNGIIIITVPFNFKIHNYPADYWRFTPECLKENLKEFTFLDIQIRGSKENPEMITAVASNKHFIPPKFQQEQKIKKYIYLFIPLIIIKLINRFIDK